LFDQALGNGPRVGDWRDTVIFASTKVGRFSA
jgi:hypothetical protein